MGVDRTVRIHEMNKPITMDEQFIEEGFEYFVLFLCYIITDVGKLTLKLLEIFLCTQNVVRYMFAAV